MERVEIPVGSVASHRWGSGLDIKVSGNPVTVEKAGFFSSDYKVSSMRFSGTWKNAGFLSSNLNLEDSAGEIIAKLEYTSFAPFKLGKLHLSEDIDQELMDLVMVVCIARIEKRRQEHDDNGAATAATAAAAAAPPAPVA